MTRLDELEKRIEMLENAFKAIRIADESMSKKLLAAYKDIKRNDQRSTQLTQDADQMLVRLNQVVETAEAVSAEWNKFLENRHIQRLINSGVV